MSEEAGIILVVGMLLVGVTFMIPLCMIHDENADEDVPLTLPGEGRIYFMKGSTCMYLDYKACDLRWENEFLHVRDYVIAASAILCVCEVGE